MKKLLCTLTFSIVALTNTASAHTWSENEYTCPLGGEKFKAAVDGSGTQFGAQLDLKPIGPIAAPFRLAVCPSNKFIIYKSTSSFAEQEIEHLALYINSPTYQELAKDNASYYLLGKIFEYEKRSSDKIASTYLQATWQATNSDKYNLYATETLKYYQQMLADNPDIEERKHTANLVIGELYRRMGQFNEAEQHFQLLASQKDYQEGLIASIIKYQLELINNKDQLPHRIPSK